MEKLIHILPKLITNEDAGWLRDTIKEPDELTQDIIKHFNVNVYNLSIMKSGQFNKKVLGDDFNYKTSVEDTLNAINRYIPIGSRVYDLIEEVNNRFNCSEKSITSVLWAASILNNLENKGAEQDLIDNLFYAAASSLYSSSMNVFDMRGELKDIVSADKKMAQFTNDSLGYALLLNSRIQQSDVWYDFNTFEELEINKDVVIDSKENLMSALKDYRNYNAVLNYVKNTYLSETDHTQDGYCENEDDRNYKAYIIVATLASEQHKHNAEFDKDNIIGLNMTADILDLRKKIDSAHILAGISNKLNGLEYAAGKIASKILGRELSIQTEKKLPFFLPKEAFRTGSQEDYIKHNLSTFEKLINPNKSFTLDLLNTIGALKNKYENKKDYKGSERTESAISYIASVLDAEITIDIEGTPKEKLMYNLNELEKACNARYDELSRMEEVFKSVKSSQKAKLDIEKLDFDKKVVGKKVAITSEKHVSTIKEFYKAVASDPILKGERNDKLRLKSPKFILADINKQVEENKDAYPELARLLSNFKMSNKEKATYIVDSYYVNADGSVNEEFKDVYKAVTDKKSTAKEQAIKDSNMKQQDKDVLNELV